jgi:hypothetical protein
MPSGRPPHVSSTSIVTRWSRTRARISTRPPRVAEFHGISRQVDECRADEARIDEELLVRLEMARERDPFLLCAQARGELDVVQQGREHEGRRTEGHRGADLRVAERIFDELVHAGEAALEDLEEAIVLHMARADDGGERAVDRTEAVQASTQPYRRKFATAEEGGTSDFTTQL